jgi:hypothetical protein
VLARWGKTSAEARTVLLQKYQNQIEAAWAGQGKRLEINSAGLRLQLTGTDVRDLSQLKGVPLTSLSLYGCVNVSDLTPLKDMPLTSLDLTFAYQVEDLTPLHGLKLTTLRLGACGKVRDLTPLQGIPLTWLNLQGCGQVHDLTPLRGMDLTEIYLTPKNITKGMDVLRQIESLNIIGIGSEAEKKWPASNFWKKYDNGDFNK